MFVSVTFFMGWVGRIKPHKGASMGACNRKILYSFLHKFYEWFDMLVHYSKTGNKNSHGGQYVVTKIYISFSLLLSSFHDDCEIYVY